MPPMTTNDLGSLIPFQAQLSELGLFPLPEELVSTSSIRVILHPKSEDQIAPGASKIGGRPDLPGGTRWPTCNKSGLFWRWI